MGITEEATATLDSEIRGNNGTVTDIRDLRKSRLSWTMQLHRQFIAAVNSLGADSECSVSFPLILSDVRFNLRSVFVCGDWYITWFAEAVPKKILEIMKVKHLTREQVASHLQVINSSF
jgi:two-component response regulator (ARR-B family)